MIFLKLLSFILAPWFSCTLNLTNSLPGIFYVICKGNFVKKGDLIAYYWKGGATYPTDSIFIKRVVGVAGDEVKRINHEFYINNVYIGTVKKTFIPKLLMVLKPSEAGVIPEGEYFVSTPHPNSLDSRYSISGNVKQEQIIGTAHKIF